MKQFTIACLLLYILHPVQAQQIAIGSGGQVTLHAGSSLSGNGITLTPTAPFTLTGATLDRSSSVIYPFANPYVTRVFTFNAPPPLFTGAITIQYDESELNGLNESALQLVVYNGSSWQNAGLSAPDPANNIVYTSGLTNLALGEMILAGSLALPLTWGAVTAQRQSTGVLITWHTEQEQQVSHFDVERSQDGLTWTTAIGRVPATNEQQPTVYRQTDKPSYQGLLYYRIRQTDLDGRYTFSRVARALADDVNTRLQVQPNPASSWFSIAGEVAASVSTVAVVNAAGSVLKTWKGFQTRYELPVLPPGHYYLRIVLTTGTTETRTILVR